MNKYVFLTEEELKEAVSNSVLIALKEYDKQKQKNVPEKTYTINQVAKMLGMSFSTVKNRIDKGLIKTAKDGRIPQSSLIEYLRKQ